MAVQQNTDEIYHILEDEICSLAILPGEALSENQLCKRFGISRTPIRSVLQRLEQNHFVQIIPCKGTIVTTIDPSVVDQIIYQRVAVECMVFRDFVQTCSPMEIIEIEHLYDLLQQAAEAAGRSTKLALEQYNAGSTDFTTVVSAQTTQYQQENSVAAAAGNTALQAVALFRALGGGWQPQPLPLPKATIDAMKKRTDWGGMLRDMESVPVAGQSEIPQAETHRGY